MGRDHSEKNLYQLLIYKAYVFSEVIHIGTNVLSISCWRNLHRTDCNDLKSILGVNRVIVWPFGYTELTVNQELWRIYMLIRSKVVTTEISSLLCSMYGFRLREQKVLFIDTPGTKDGSLLESS